MFLGSGFFFFKQKTAYEMRISDWSSDVCSSDLLVRNAEDQLALATLARDPEIAQLATSADAVALLWEVCQVPDFRKILSDHHAQLLSQLYLRLMHNGLRLPEDWVAGQLEIGRAHV